MLSQFTNHKSIILLTVSFIGLASTASIFACTPPPQCTLPGRYVMWAIENGIAFAKSELGDSVYLNYYGSSPYWIKYAMVPQNYVNGTWVNWAVADYSYHTSPGCGDCNANECFFNPSGGQEIAYLRTNTTITMSYNSPRSSLSGYVSGTHYGWNCYKEGWGSYVIPPASSPARLNVYVVKVDIKRNGTSIVDLNPTVSVGEKISLTGSVEPTGLYGSLPSWTILGDKIKNYIATTTEGRKVDLSSSDYTASSIDYYWYTGGEDVYVGYNVTINGGIWGISTEFDVKRPSSGIKTEMQPLYHEVIPLQQNMFEYFLGLGWVRENGERKKKKGITFNLDNWNANGVSEGSISWLQIVNNTSSQYFYNNQWLNFPNSPASNKLDTTLPYSQNFPDWDSPSSTVRCSNTVTKVKRYDNFSMWLMYKSSTDQSIYVPLSKVDWSWGMTLLTNNTLEDSYSSPGQTVGPVNAGIFPEWSGNIVP